MDERKVTIRDIAGELGLSTATVSNVLHGKTHKVSEATARRVLELLEERRYLPGMAELLLAQNGAKIVGVVVNDHEKYERHTLEDAFIASALNALSTEAAARGLQLMVKQAGRLEEIPRFSTMWNLEGLIIIGFCAQDYGSLRSRVCLPFVVYDGCGATAERVCCINADDRQGGFLVGEYFRQGGHRRALCVADNDTCMDQARWEGFLDGFGREGAKRLLVPMQRAARLDFYAENLDALTACTAIFAVSDHYAAELIHFLNSRRLSVPGDISVAGFDDTPVCHMVYPSLTSVRQDTAQRARLALDKLRQLREGQDVEPSVTLPVTLIRRSSSRSL